MTNNFDLADRPVDPGSSQPSVPWIVTSRGYFDAMRIRLLKGRLPDATDTVDSPQVIAVSESWAERFYPGEEVLGRQLWSGGDRENPVTIVGVVNDVAYTGVDAADASVIYFDYHQGPWRSVNLVIRGDGRPVSVEPIRAAIAEIDRDVPLTNIQTMQESLSASLSRPRYWATMLTIFAAIGIILAVIGIYGVLSYSVNRQARSIGIRMALGASASTVRASVIGRGMRQAGIGLGIGIGLTLIVLQSIRGLLFGVSPGDPATLGMVVVLLFMVALAACWLPARRATRLDPMKVLAEE
jgi:predicted permease